MPIQINGNGTITGLSAGGLPAGTVTSATLASGLANQGITMAQAWRITSNYDIAVSAGNTDLTSNWESVDTTGAGSIGSNLSESSGIFTFPSTGIYKIDAFSEFYSQWPDSASADNWRIIYRIKTTTNNSSYSTVSIASTFIEAPASKFNTLNLSYIFDVTDTSTHKFKLSQEVEQATVTFYGDTNVNQTGFYVTRLGDT